MSHYLQRLTREAGPDRGTHGCPQSRRGPQTSPRGGPHAGPGPPGCGALSGPLSSAACGSAEGPRRGPWPGPQPVRRESLYKPPLSLASRRRGKEGAEKYQVDVQENKSGDAEDAWRGRRSGNRLSIGALLSRLELPPRARARGEPGPLGLPAWTETGFQAAPGSVRAAPELQAPSARHLRLRNGPGPAPD